VTDELIDENHLRVAARRQAMKDIDFQSMTTDELWALHGTITSILSTKMNGEKQKLEKQLDELHRRFGTAESTTPKRRPYPKVQAKFQNPERPFETWSGRGKQPRWVSKLLAAGKTIDDLRISSRR
jgi:DNA-binding protein H-NS